MRKIENISAGKTYDKRPPERQGCTYKDNVILDLGVGWGVGESRIRCRALMKGLMN